MSTTKQTASEMERESALRYTAELLDRTFSPEVKKYFEAALKRQKAQTDANKAEVQRREEEERKHRGHLRRVKDLERDNDRRNPSR